MSLGRPHQNLDCLHGEAQAKEMPRPAHTMQEAHLPSPWGWEMRKVGDALPLPGCRSHGNGAEMPVAKGDGCCSGNSGSGSG